MKSDSTERRISVDDEPEDVLARLFRSGRYDSIVSWVLERMNEHPDRVGFPVSRSR